MAIECIPNKGRAIRRFPLASGETPVEGAPVVLDASGEVTECGADPATILGFMAHSYNLTELDPDPGYVLVYVALPGSTFWMEGDAAPVQADVGVSYDLNVDGNGVAYVDGASSAAARLEVEDIDTTRNLYEVSVLAANRQLQA